MEPAQLWEGMVSGDEGTPGRLGAPCEGLGTAGMDGGGTGKRDRQRVPRGKRKVRLSRPRKASSIRPGRGGHGGTRGVGDRLVARVGAGWLWQVALPREGEEAVRHSQPGRHPSPPPRDAPVPAQPGSSTGREGTLGECDPPFPPPRSSLSLPVPIPPPLTRGSPHAAAHLCISSWISPHLALNLPNSASSCFKLVSKSGRQPGLSPSPWAHGCSAPSSSSLLGSRPGKCTLGLG